MTRPQFRMDISLGHVMTMAVVIFGAGSAFMEVRSIANEAHTRLDTVVDTVENRFLSIESRTENRNIRTRERIAAVEAIQRAQEKEAARFDERMSAQQQTLERIERSQSQLLQYVRQLNGETR